MGKTVQVTCDGCGHDLTTRTNCVDYRLVLDAESKPGSGSGFYTAMMIYPPVARAYYFCGLQCLDHWTNRRQHLNSLSRGWWDAWKREHGNEHTPGFFSYPEPPSELREARKAEFDAAALAAFPMTRDAAQGIVTRRDETAQQARGAERVEPDGEADAPIPNLPKSDGGVK